MSIPAFEEIIEPNDQTAARSASLEALGGLVGNVYPNKFERSAVSGVEDTITNVLQYGPIVKIVKEIKAVVATLAERERPPAEVKEALNARLKEFGNVRIAGRLTTPPRGNFVHLTDGMNKLQIYAKKATFALVKNDAGNTLDEENGWAAWQLLDHGDFIGVEGYLFITNTGELSVHVEKLQFLAKAMLPMPDKMHGIADAEIKQRQRYVDLIGSSLRVESQETGDERHELTTREVFETRAKVISSLRRFLEDHGYIEVETPMLTPKATGAAATPFETHHNALDIKLYARIAPELYLKRLVVGGFEKVYELNRNFRNEGISYKHNPEFTMLEFYCAYMDVNGMMDFCEELMRQSVQKATGGLVVEYEGKTIDFRSFRRSSMENAVRNGWNSGFGRLAGSSLDEDWLTKTTLLRRLLAFPILLSLELNKALASNISSGHPPDGILSEAFASTQQHVETERSGEVWERTKLFESSIPSECEANENGIEQEFLALISQQIDSVNWFNTEQTLGLLEKFFEKYAERHLGMSIENGKEVVYPTFIIDYPKSISPLSKVSPSDPTIAERFELFINGMEVANGFSELNDPKEQYERFVDQMSERERGDEEAMVLDEDYIRALSYGMPPAAGIGIGIDRLVMLLTNKHSIRDVILFPHMRPEKRTQESPE